MLLPKQAVGFRELRKQGFGKKYIQSMCASLKLFPTPFKGIYYVPLEEERKGAFIEKPFNALAQAIRIFLGTDEFYFSCATAEKALGLKWQPDGGIHVVNAKLSRKIDLKGRASRNEAKKGWRARKIAALLPLYGSGIVFHKSDCVGCAKTKETPYGRFATKSQIKLDRKKFGERE